MRQMDQPRAWHPRAGGDAGQVDRAVAPASRPLPDGMPESLLPLAELAQRGDVPLVSRRSAPGGDLTRRGAVLLLITGSRTADLQVLLEERSHRMRSQPGQFALPGGAVEPADHNDIDAALREAHEETGLDPARLRVLGAFAPIPMPRRDYRVRPVLAWAPRTVPLPAPHPAEVETLRWVRLRGKGSLSDPSVHIIGTVHGTAMGAAFDLPENGFVWGFTAAMLDGLLGHLGLQRPEASAPHVEIPALRRRSRA